MCFGPDASFASSAVLAGIGIAALKRVTRKEQLLIAVFPFFFAVQQFDEGLLWLGLLHGANPATLHWLSFVFLLFAVCIWPLCTPCSIYLLEPKSEKRKLMAVFILLGATLAVYCLFFLLNGSCSAKITRSCIEYKRDLPGSDSLLGAIYLLSIFGATFLSSHRLLVRFAMINFVSGCFAFYYHHRAFISIWCFFAALTSALIYFFLADLNTQRSQSYQNLLAAAWFDPLSSALKKAGWRRKYQSPN